MAIPPSSRSSRPPDSDGRRAQRHPYVHFTWFCLVGAQAGHLGHTLNVSNGGVAFLTAEKVDVGDRLLLVLMTPHGRVSCIVKVVHVTNVDTTWRVGAIVEVVPPTDSAAWDNLLSKEAP